MAARARSRASAGARPGGASRPETRFDRRLGEILEHATEVFYEKGYEGASMRDLSRASGMSLAGLYYYFESKEKLLYLVQKHTFSTVMESLKQKLEGVDDPEQRLRVFIRNHLDYFLANLKSMKVLSHEGDALSGPLLGEIANMKRDYYSLCRGVVEDIRRETGRQFHSEISSRVAVLSLFGMMNWIYTWHNPRHDLGASELAEQMADIFIHGVAGAVPKSGSVGGPGAQKPAARRQRSASSNI